jgi:hypothetical protein
MLIVKKYYETGNNEMYLTQSITNAFQNISKDIKNELSCSIVSNYSNIETKMVEKIKDIEISIQTRDIKNKFTPSLKGCISENDLFEVLSNELYEEWEVIKTNTSGNKKGDIFLRKNETSVIIDLKDYSSNIPSSQVDKIKRDMSLHKSHGLLVSINTNINKHKDFSFEIVEGRILAFISKGDIVSKIKSWTNMISFLEKMLNKEDNNTLSFSQEEVEYLINVNKNYEGKIKNFKEFLEDSIKRSKNELIKLETEKSQEVFLFLQNKIRS